MRLVTVVTVLCTVLLSSAGGRAAAQLRVDVEGGVAFSGYNDVQIPGDSGTRFSLTDDLETDAPGSFPGAFFLPVQNRQG